MAAREADYRPGWLDRCFYGWDVPGTLEVPGTSLAWTNRLPREGNPGAWALRVCLGYWSMMATLAFSSSALIIMVALRPSLLHSCMMLSP